MGSSPSLTHIASQFLSTDRADSGPAAGSMRLELMTFVSTLYASPSRQRSVPHPGTRLLK